MRELNELEKAIVAKKAKRKGKELRVLEVEYHDLFPRSTLCVLRINVSPYAQPAYGVTMRNKHEPNIPFIGEVQSLVRALDSMK